jgi:short subunit dehydrogenase-like uncharacterized protein
MDALLYGANGYTGRLIAAAAKREGIPVTLAGRRREAVEPIARELSLPWKAFSLDDPGTLVRELKPYAALLLAAGPFSATSSAAVEGCLAAGTAYLDITGEIDVFEALFARDAEARAAGIAVLPGVGFDVVPSDCLAASLANALPGGRRLQLAFKGFRTSAGTMKTMLEGAPKGGRVRVSGALVTVPVGWKVREIPFPGGPRLAMTIPWGDLSTAYRSTGIPDIETYMALPQAAIAAARRSALFAPLMGVGAVQTFLKWRVEKTVHGPTAEERERERSLLWGRVETEDRAVEGVVETLEGYALTAETAVLALSRVLAGRVAPGVLTPSAAFGPGFISEVGKTEMRIGRTRPIGAGLD